MHKEDSKQVLYDALPSDTFIRCLILESGTDDAPIECWLEDTDLDSKRDYEAISYVWGSRTKSEEIICNGKPALITVNLSKALRQIRYASKRRVLWADSLCIDQDSEDEKNQQVALMGKIYACASRVSYTRYRR